LTGESLPIALESGDIAKSGSIIRKGEVEAYVHATGAHTYIGEAMSLVGKFFKYVMV
jgi:H+-transporting ATPase